MSTIKDLYEGGWLKYGSKHYSPEDRLKVANWLRDDFDVSGGYGVKSTDYSKPRVDGGNAKINNTARVEALERFCKAYNSISPQYRAYVRWVCCDDKPFKIKGSRWEVACKKTYNATLLCLGLDELIKYYVKPHKRK